MNRRQSLLHLTSPSHVLSSYLEVLEGFLGLGPLVDFGTLIRAMILKHTLTTSMAMTPIAHLSPIDWSIFTAWINFTNSSQTLEIRIAN